MKSTRPSFKVFKTNPALKAVQRAVKGVKDAEVFVVGGAVRDILLKRPMGDIDVLVRGVPLKKLQATLKKSGEVNLVGKSFGVLKFKPKRSKEDIDIALPRTEHAFGTGGTRDVDVQFDHRLPLTEDLVRRDFTMNALAVNLATGELIDEFGGLNDLAARRLRAVGSATLRFQEDYSRLLRGLRLAVELGLEFEDQTWTALKRLMPHIGSAAVPRELVAREFLRGFEADPLKTIDLWDITGAFRATMPEVLEMKKCPQPRQFHTEGDVWEHSRLAVEQALSPAFKKEFKTRPSLETLVAIFLHDIGKPHTLTTPEKHGTDRIRTNGHDVVGAKLAQSLAERLTFSSYHGKVDAERLAGLIRSHLIALSAKDMRPSTLEKYFLADREHGNQLLQVIWADSAATIDRAGKPAFGAYQDLQKRLKKISPRPKAPTPLVRGDELMKMFSLASGPIIGSLLDQLRDAQLEGKVKTRHAAFRLAKKRLAEKK